MSGMDRYDDKRKRAMRRRNHIARDLQENKYRQRVKRKKVRDDHWEIDDVYEG